MRKAGFPRFLDIKDIGNIGDMQLICLYEYKSAVFVLKYNIFKLFSAWAPLPVLLYFDRSYGKT